MSEPSSSEINVDTPPPQFVTAPTTEVTTQQTGQDGSNSNSNLDSLFGQPTVVGQNETPYPLAKTGTQVLAQAETAQPEQTPQEFLTAFTQAKTLKEAQYYIDKLVSGGVTPEQFEQALGANISDAAKEGIQKHLELFSRGKITLMNPEATPEAIKDTMDELSAQTGSDNMVTQIRGQLAPERAQLVEQIQAQIKTEDEQQATTVMTEALQGYSEEERKAILEKANDYPEIMKELGLLESGSPAAPKEFDKIKDIIAAEVQKPGSTSTPEKSKKGFDASSALIFFWIIVFNPRALDTLVAKLITDKITVPILKKLKFPAKIIDRMKNYSFSSSEEVLKMPPREIQTYLKSRRKHQLVTFLEDLNTTQRSAFMSRPEEFGLTTDIVNKIFFAKGKLNEEDSRKLGITYVAV